MSKELILRLLPKLNESELDEVITTIELSKFKSDLIKLRKEVQQTRYSNGHFECPVCHGTHVVKNGTRNGVQRYLCRSCNKPFSNQTSTPTAYSKKKAKVWIEYIGCMMAGYSIRKCAEICNINIATSFFWRHKIMNALASFVNIGEVDGLVEADETFFRFSKKGNRTKGRTYGKGASMPKKKKSKKVHKKRGLSKQQVAVGTALDRHGNLLIGLIGRGRLKYDALKRFFEGHIAPHSTLCTDSAHGYARIADELNLEHIQIESGKRKKDIYHIQHVNSLHSSLKTFMRKFRGVATKHLHHYLYGFKWVELFKHEKEVMKIQKAYIHAQSTYSTCSIKDILLSKPLFA